MGVDSRSIDAVGVSHVMDVDDVDEDVEVCTAVVHVMAGAAWRHR